MSQVLIFIIVLCLLSGRVSAKSSSYEMAQDKALFCDGPDNLVPKPTPLPNVVLAALMNTRKGKEVRRIAAQEGLEPAEMFRNTRVHLADSTDMFFLVIRYPDQGGKTEFWIIRQSPTDATILLFVSAKCLEIARIKHHGYNNIVASCIGELKNSTQIDIYTYDGRSYRLSSRKLLPPLPPSD
jgi:hypothetical protein